MCWHYIKCPPIIYVYGNIVCIIICSCHHPVIQVCEHGIWLHFNISYKRGRLSLCKPLELVHVLYLSRESIETSQHHKQLVLSFRIHYRTYPQVVNYITILDCLFMTYLLFAATVISGHLHCMAHTLVHKPFYAVYFHHD